MRRKKEIRKFLTFIIRQIATKIFGKIIFKPLYFRKDSSSPRNRTNTNFIARSKSTLDSLKSVFYVFRRKPSLGAPG